MTFDLKHLKYFKFSNNQHKGRIKLLYWKLFISADNLSTKDFSCNGFTTIKCQPFLKNKYSIVDIRMTACR